MNPSKEYLNVRKVLRNRHQMRIYLHHRPPLYPQYPPVRRLAPYLFPTPSFLLHATHARANIHLGRAEARYRRHLPPKEIWPYDEPKSSVNPRFSRWTMLITTPSTPDAHLHHPSTPPFLPPPPSESLTSPQTSSTTSRATPPSSPLPGASTPPGPVSARYFSRDDLHPSSAKTS
ncbi:hypothetical protein DXG01_010006 [Tephrocybe rancida]|nr:hypothetical protein DXG01_010006 [Tephrocybe rancida]